MPKGYPISSYDKNLCLKPNITMWLIAAFLLRPYVVSALSLVNKRDRMELINIFYSDKLALSLGAFAGIPAALLVYAWLKRSPEASGFIRRLWENGRVLLASSAILSAGIILFIPYLLETIHHVTVYDWAQLLISVAIVLILYTSSYIKDCFADFPDNKN